MWSRRRRGLRKSSIPSPTLRTASEGSRGGSRSASPPRPGTLRARPDRTLRSDYCALAKENLRDEALIANAPDAALLACLCDDANKLKVIREAATAMKRWRQTAPIAALSSNPTSADRGPMAKNIVVFSNSTGQDGGGRAGQRICNIYMDVPITRIRSGLVPARVDLAEIDKNVGRCGSARDPLQSDNALPHGTRSSRNERLRLHLNSFVARLIMAIAPRRYRRLS